MCTTMRHRLGALMEASDIGARHPYLHDVVTDPRQFITSGCHGLVRGGGYRFGTRPRRRPGQSRPARGRLILRKHLRFYL